MNPPQKRWDIHVPFGSPSFYGEVDGVEYDVIFSIVNARRTVKTAVDTNNDHGSMRGSAELALVVVIHRSAGLLLRRRLAPGLLLFQKLRAAHGHAGTGLVEGFSIFRPLRGQLFILGCHVSLI